MNTNTHVANDSIRRATKADIQDLLIIEQESFSDPWPKSLLIEEMRRKNPDGVWIYEDNPPNISGFLCMRSLCGELEILNIAVQKELRRKGIGIQLMRFAIQTAKKMNYSGVILEVRESNTAAQALYEHLGFIVTGRRPRYYNRPKEDAILYTLDLSKVHGVCEIQSQ